MKTVHTEMHISSPHFPSDHHTSISKGLLSIVTWISHGNLTLTWKTELIIPQPQTPLVFKARCFGLSSLQSRVGVPDIRQNPLGRQGVALCVWGPSHMDARYLGRDFWWSHVPGSPTHLDTALYALLWRIWSASFQVIFRQNCFICSYRFVVFTAGGVFRIFLHHHLEPHPLNFTALPYFFIKLFDIQCVYSTYRASQIRIYVFIRNNVYIIKCSIVKVDSRI